MSELQQRRKSVRQSALAIFVREYEWIHWGLGLLGNLTFFVGSILFLSDDTESIGVWLFIIGSAGMLIGSLGRYIVWRDRKQRENAASQ